MQVFKKYWSRWFLTVPAAFAMMAGASLAVADNHLMAGDGAHVVLGGDVIAVNGMTFELDYSGGRVTVEMEDWDEFNEANMVNPGETVTVNGRIDNAFYEERKIEADSVYVAERGIRYLAEPDDVEGDLSWTAGQTTPSLAAQGTWIGLSGEVVAVGAPSSLSTPAAS